MTQTIEKIESVMSLFNSLGLTTNLTNSEIEMIEQELKSIAGTAIMEAQNAIQNILPSLYNKVTA